MSVRFFLLIRASWCFAAAAFPICCNSAAVQYGKRGEGIPWVLAWLQRTDTSHVSSRSAQRTAQVNINCAVFFAQAPGLISPSLAVTPTYPQTCTFNSLKLVALLFWLERTCTSRQHCLGNFFGATLFHVMTRRSWR